MFIRRTKTRKLGDDKHYFTYRLVEGIRVGSRVVQRTLLNLGSQFELPQDEWPLLASRIEELLKGQTSLIVHEEVEYLAQRYTAQIIARQPAESVEESVPDESLRFQEVDVSTLELIQPRTVGVEHMALSAMHDLRFEEKLAELGFNKPQIAAAMGNIIGRMAFPASERATYHWLRQRSALGELLEYEFETMDLQRLYRSADQLLKHREAIESHLYGEAKSLFKIQETIALYDLTNTYFEGLAEQNPKAKRGRSKEKRSDCPLVTMGLVLDGSGFPKCSKIFEGNVGETTTLASMLQDLSAVPGSIIVIDAGIASEENLEWLTQQGFFYIAVSREAHREFNPDTAISFQTAQDQTLQAQRVVDEITGEVRLYCYSEQRKRRDNAIHSQKAERFEATLQALANSLKPALSNPAKLQASIEKIQAHYADIAPLYSIEWVMVDQNVRGLRWANKASSTLSKRSAQFEKRLQKLADKLSAPTPVPLAKLHERIGRAKQKYASAAKYYQVDVTQNEAGTHALNLRWVKNIKPDDRSGHPGVYCLRSTANRLTEEMLWKTYIMLTQLESVFRSLKTDLGLRPVFHQTEERVEAHLFVSVLAYYFVHTLRLQLKAKGIDESWGTIRQTMSTPVRMTTTLKRKDGKMVHIRQANRPEVHQQKIYEALRLSICPGGKKITVV